MAIINKIDLISISFDFGGIVLSIYIQQLVLTKTIAYSSSKLMREYLDAARIPSSSSNIIIILHLSFALVRRISLPHHRNTCLCIRQKNTLTNKIMSIVANGIASQTAVHQKVLLATSAIVRQENIAIFDTL